MKRKIKVVIDRSKWRTGSYGREQTGEGYTELLNEQGYMCCLGFCMNASKVPKKDLLGFVGPKTVFSYFESSGKDPKRTLRSNGVRALISSKSGIYTSTPLTNAAIAINDSTLTPPEEKEQQLLKLFKDSVFDIEFAGRYHFPE